MNDTHHRTSLLTSSVLKFQRVLTFRLLSRLGAVLYEIYRPDNKPLTLMLPVNTSVQDVMSAIVKPGGDHVLVKMNSTGGGETEKTHLVLKDIVCYCKCVRRKTTEPSSSVRSSFDPHRKSSAEAGCHCGLHSAGTQRETVHLHEQPSGSAGEDCGALQVRRILTIIEAVFTVFLPLFLPPDASEGAAGSRARNDRRPGTDEL